jgi:GT2 family glycosyltransferase
VTVEKDQRTVMAMVLTHNSPDSLRRTLKAIAAQTRRPEAVLVVDNASDPKVDVDVFSCFEQTDISTRIVEEEVNSGPAGGWARALEIFRDENWAFGWILDDDIIPPADGLARLMEEMARLGDRALVIPRVRQPSGVVTAYPAWHGALLTHEIVQEVGVPLADFFWWNEDTEYLMWRIPRAGFPLVYSRQVIVEHSKGRGQFGNPPWKYYYESRNTVYWHFRMRHGRGRWPRKLTGLVARALIKEHDHRLLRLALVGRGIGDGLAGRLGRQVNPARFG